MKVYIISLDDTSCWDYVDEVGEAIRVFGTKKKATDKIKELHQFFGSLGLRQTEVTDRFNGVNFIEFEKRIDDNQELVYLGFAEREVE